MRKLLLLRPEPGLSASAERATALGLEVIAVPLFRAEPVAWQMPDPSDYDALLLTSANAIRHGGAGLATLYGLPAYAVGAATAAAAEEASFTIAGVGEAGVSTLLTSVPEGSRLLHLAGEDRIDTDSRHGIDIRTVYRMIAIGEPGLPALDGLVVAIHSPRAGQRLAELVDRRDRAVIAAISAEAARACGDGWQSVAIAERPEDSSLLALAARLCHTSSPE